MASMAIQSSQASQHNRFIHRLFPGIVTLVFAAIEAGAIGHHAMWRDETQAWEIAAGSPSLWGTFGRIRYEGHPPLWFVLLYFVSRFTQNPRAMQVLHWLLATSGVYVLMRFSPFKMAQRTGLAFGYFIAYEYSVISREYVLGILLTFTVCALLCRPRRSVWGIAITLFLLANVSIYSLMIVAAVMLGMVVERMIAHRDSEEDRSGDSMEDRSAGISRAEIAGLLIVLLGAGISIATVWPKMHGYYRTAETRLVYADTGRVPGFARPIELDVFRFWRGVEPILDPYNTSAVWGTNYVIDRMPAGKWIASFGTLVLFGLCFVYTMRKPLALTLFLSGAAGLLVLFFLNAPDQSRHIGHFFIVIVASFWLANSEGPMAFNRMTANTEAKRVQLSNGLMWFLIICQCVGAAVAIGVECFRPFSQSYAFAEFMKDEPSDAVLIVNPEWKCSEIGALLQRDAYLPVAQTFGRYAIYSEDEQFATEDQLKAAFHRFDPSSNAASSPPILLISDDPMVINAMNDYRLREVARFVGAMAPNEDFYVYRVWRGR